MQPVTHQVLASIIQFTFESFAYLFICMYFMYISKHWRWLQIPNVAFTLFAIISLIFMPETPRFLVSNKNFDEARKVFNIIARWNGMSKNTADNFSFLKSHAQRERDVEGRELETDASWLTEESQ